ncbi:hypothetical protein PX52LOC_01714 [Limnoglobus roseus]|uniref:Uncharacterized protein n=2 Tax=Limnoglobus roseus TaxID=2598579 RepID=A0A5C1A9V5_9BACT|nr:hypothetical protein PX52LOC_01714 [Limnoglobus roseus]
MLRLLSGLAGALPLRVTDADGKLACLIQVWDATRPMPTASAARRPRSPGQRAGCKGDILAAIRDAGRPLTRKQIVKLFRDERKGHGPGTVAKALADLTKAGELVNPKDKRGYRLAEWPRAERTPSMFEGIRGE